MGEEAGELSLLFRRLARLAVKRNVDARLGLLRALRRGGASGRCFLLVVLRLIGHALMRAHRLEHGGGRQAEGQHQAGDEQHREQDHRERLFHQLDEHDGKRRGEDAAGFHRKTALPEELCNAVHTVVVRLAQYEVEHRAEQHRQQRRAHHAGGDVPPAVEEQDIAHEQQHGRDRIIAVADESAAQRRGAVEQPATLLEVAERDAQRQHKAHHAADLAANGTLLRRGGALAARRRLFACRRPLAGRGSFLRCHSLPLYTIVKMSTSAPTVQQ